MKHQRVEPAMQYSQMLCIKHTLFGRHVNSYRVRLYDGHRYSWVSVLISGTELNIPTDQTYNLNANYTHDVRNWDEVWLDGVCIYKKPLWQRWLFWWKDYR